jgi:hypothetical protein
LTSPIFHFDQPTTTKESKTMPNHCANSLKLTAKNFETRATLATIRAELSAENPHIFQLIDPCPQELNDTRAGFPKDDREAANIEKFGFPHWYDFNLNRWGTKWEAYEVTLLIDKPDTLVIEFDTAWSPPEGIYRTLHAQGFDVEATYCEAGADYIGYWKNGHDHTESLSGVIPQIFDEEINNAYDMMHDYFAAHAIDHTPPHFGG